MTTLWKAGSCLLQAIYCWLQHMLKSVLPDSWNMKSVQGQVALITGAGSGIGRLLACNLARRGAQIVVWDINDHGGAETVRMVKELGGQAWYFRCDISDRADVYRTATEVKAKVGKVDILVNNAGIVSGKRLLEIPDEMIEKTFQVNAVSHFWTVKAFLPDMMETDSGHIVSIASLAGLQGLAQLTDYCSSKFAAVGFYESLSVELKTTGYEGIDTTVICPFFIDTGMFAGAESRIIKFLKPEYVAGRIERAILLNEDQVVMPGWLHYLFYTKLCLPRMSNVWLMRAFGVAKSMAAFTGRQKID